MCKLCRKNYYKRKDYFRKHYTRNRDRKLATVKTYYQLNNEEIRKKLRLTRYGITVEEYEALYQKQRGKCAICKAAAGGVKHGKPILLSIDHDHETNTVRGLLCSKCNFAIGLMDDQPLRLRRAAAYLEKHRDVPDVSQQLRR